MILWANALVLLLEDETDILVPAMDVLVQFAASRFRVPHRHRPSRTFRRQCVFTVRSSFSLPFPQQKAKYYEHLQAAVDVVERACRLCVDVQSSLFSSDSKIIQKIDQTPVTVADFGVQALVSLEMSKLFPTIPLVAEEDSTFVRENNLVDAVVEVVTDKSSISGKELSQDDVLKAIDRGGKDAYLFGPEPATYWILDPIDGTRGFVRGSEALYVVGLSLVVEGEIVLGVMGCPNWQDRDSDIINAEVQGEENTVSRSGIIMISHVGCGTWRTRLWHLQNSNAVMAHNWTRCLVDRFHQVHEARFCIPDSQTWETLPLCTQFNATTDANSVGEKEVLLLPTCCGSLSKYLTVASGRASVFILRARTKTVIKVWDHAVGLICIQEAGGKVTDWKGSKLDFAADQTERRVIFPSGGVLVTNDTLHNSILEIISSC
ncbi:Salt-sensitive 3'-phosphoadenosine-5'-phosphatase HAL2/SAL1 [Handroanthus impetiginosus]|uniref:Salt-sensitive 3'-phosphoadenosine-5'-phosphatase HAL2/SAL1 n=1 Tax=Handroanthus impetiginosus TaxID=429701 RepID=A0A2G9HM15_9LAMI|nr:Salt-sensitive 3'-phosphoadenosine-5'-phosphatase HAL2/SAL1 [Handroanthus impetiginosus]